MNIQIQHDSTNTSQALRNRAVRHSFLLSLLGCSRLRLSHPLDGRGPWCQTAFRVEFTTKCTSICGESVGELEKNAGTYKKYLQKHEFDN